MKGEQVLRLLEEVAQGRITTAAAVERLSTLQVEELGDGQAAPFARIDHHRGIRQGQPEVVFCQGKRPEQVVGICERLVRGCGGFLATRADAQARQALLERFPAAVTNDLARTVHLPWNEADDRPVLGEVLVVSAGTADLPVAEEAAVTAEVLGNPVARLYDVGVAGIHRLLEQTPVLRSAAVTIVVAGMEGALPSVVAGLVAHPVIAVPTSVGYGASFGGLSALLSMLTSCAAGLTVVNIDNGFGAAFAASRINHLAR